MGANGRRETEWQLDAVDFRPLVRRLAQPLPEDGSEAARAVPGSSLQLVDRYLDTQDQRFRRAGYALRIRRVGRRRGAEATLASLEPGARDGNGRAELSEPIASIEPGALAAAAGPVAERVRAVAGRAPLQQLFEVRTRRRTFALELDGVAAGAIALDEASIAPGDGGPPALLRRVEITAPRALEPFVAALRDACGLQPARLSTYELGLLSADVPSPRAERFGPTAVEPELSIAAVATATLRRHFSAMLAREPGTRLGDDIEELHEMRVATRRLRAALSLFGDALPPGVMRLRDELGWVGSVLGDVRDLDVQIEQLDSWEREVPERDREALEPLRVLLEERRGTARRTMLEALDSRRYEAFVTRFGRALRARDPRPAAAPALAVAPDLVEARFRSFRKGAKRIHAGSPPEEYHRLRIRAKRLRYALEFLGDLYGRDARPAIRRLVALQDILGLHQDADVAIERLRELAAQHGRELRPETLFAMGIVAERYSRSMVEMRSRFPAAYRRTRGRSWKALVATMEARRPAPAPPAANEADPAAAVE